MPTASHTLMVSFNAKSAGELIALVRRIEARLPFLEPSLAERVFDAFKRPGDLVRAITSNGDFGATAGAADLGVSLKPTRRLLELARASGAADFDARIQHDSPPALGE